jgi:LPS sulfotransferase NodH
MRARWRVSTQDERSGRAVISGSRSFQDPALSAGMPRRHARGISVNTISEKKAAAFTPYERNLFGRMTEPWLTEKLTAEIQPGETLLRDESQLIIICMTPRSGSSALSAALNESKTLGKGGERLNSKEGGALEQAMERNNPKSIAGLLDAVISEARSPNGVSQIKCDLPQILPFLMNRDSFERMRHAKFVYLTREDVMDQAISRYKGFQTGYWHSTQGDAPQKGEIPFDFDGIRQQVVNITNMMAAYERIFAFFGINPYRITYEQVVTQCGEVIRNIAKLVDVEVEGDISIDSGGHTKIADERSARIKERFLTEFVEL